MPLKSDDENEKRFQRMSSLMRERQTMDESSRDPGCKGERSPKEKKTRPKTLLSADKQHQNTGEKCLVHSSNGDELSNMHKETPQRCPHSSTLIESDGEAKMPRKEGTRRGFSGADSRVRVEEGSQVEEC